MLHERYRPTALQDVIGQGKAIAQIQNAGRHGFGGLAFWISGQSGTGKTTIARIIAQTIADPFCIEEYDSADQVTAEEFRRLDATAQLHGFGKGGRAIIINEAHGLRAPIVRLFLGFLERIPSHVVVIFTTTTEAMSLFEDAQLDASPLLSRTVEIRLTSQGLCNPFAERVKQIATAEGLDGAPIEAYQRLAKTMRNNMRRMLMAVESGQMNQ